MVKHGGLTRVGKVRSQTRRPETTESPVKEPTGRAAVRARYTKRTALLSGQNARYRFNAQI